MAAEHFYVIGRNVGRLVTFLSLGRAGFFNLILKESDYGKLG